MVNHNDIQVQGQDWLKILGDWFFERDELKQYYRLVESCPASAAGLPCNPACSYTPNTPSPPSPAPAPSPGGRCGAALTAAGCLSGTHTRSSCAQCAQEHEADLAAAGCTPKDVRLLCKV